MVVVGVVLVVVVVAFVLIALVVVGIVLVLICNVWEVVEEDSNRDDVMGERVTWPWVVDGSLVVDRFVVGVLEGTGTDVVTVVCSNCAQIGNGGSP